LQKFIDKANKVLLMSATIVDPWLLLRSKSVPVEPDEISFARADDFITPSLRPIVYMPVMPVSFWNREFDKLADAVVYLLQNLKNYRGIVHTVNFEIARSLAKRQIPGAIVQTSSSESSYLAGKFRAGQGRVLIGPAFLRGLDLPGDLGRFVIFPKIPFPDLREEAPEGVDWQRWYYWVTLRNLLQGSGRCSRAPDDWSVVFILDANFSWFYHQNWTMFPNWWHLALRKEGMCSKIIRLEDYLGGSKWV
jgi:Rad3-related DNA helicase